MTPIPQQRTRKDVRRAVLDAAMELAHADGPSQLTLEAVAARAGISKGGLLHYFNTKEALLTAMVGDVIGSFDDNLSDSAGPRTSQMNLLVTHVERSFAGSGQRSRSAMALLAVAALQPSLMAPLRNYMEQRSAAVIADARAPAVALAAMLIADAVYLFDALGTPLLSGVARDEVLGLTLGLLQQAGAEPCSSIQVSHVV